MKKKLRLALLWGGESSEHSVSRMGAKNLLSQIDREKLDVISVRIDKRGNWHADGPHHGKVYPCRARGRGALISEDGSRIAIDVAFPLLHGEFGEDGRVQGALDCAHIPYVGCGVAAGAVCADKILTKKVAESLGIPVADSVYFTTKVDNSAAKRICEERIGYPMFIKPAGCGSSVGCSLVPSPEEFDSAFDAAKAHGDRVLVEEYLDGAREIECAYSETSRFGEVFAPPGEVTAHGVYTYSAKYSRSSTAKTALRALLSPTMASLAEGYSHALVTAIGIRQIARIDYFLHGGRLILNEINTMPGFTPSSLYAAMLGTCGIPTSELITALARDAYDRRV